MFNTLASYLLGNTNNQNNQEDNPETNLNNNNNNHNNLTTAVCDDDDDWLLVVERDKDDQDSLPRTDSEEELSFIDIKNSPLINQNCHSNRINDELVNRNPTQYRPAISGGTNSMEESWFVTPPPCFTSTGPINMETSPLENLLIEHPSMSVYRFMRSSTHLIEDDIVVLDFNINDLEPNPAEERTPINTGRVTRQSERAARNRTDRTDQITEQEAKQCMLLRNAQKSHDRKVRQTLCRSALERTNKVREINSKGGRQKRSDMYNSRIISRANNNRKC